ncbi:unannotated protein [freshwater metagenome]|uniref:Unannotated protein n=1 Tax=freshwater metagenome TaxID=449393 RepID=A0A6J6NSE8_9ZZZZ
MNTLFTALTICFVTGFVAVVGVGIAGMFGFTEPSR